MPKQTRREWLRAVGAAGVVGIAGCLPSVEAEPSLQNSTQQTKLVADDGDSDDAFGYSVALSSDGATALIGALNDEDPNGTQAGSAYAFANSGGSWTQQAKLAANDGDSEDLFGWSVTVSSDGSTVLIGAPNDEDPNGNRAGSAYVFNSTGDSWIQQTKLTPDDGDSVDVFGVSVALSSDGSTALIGAGGDEDPNGFGAGSAYVFDSSGGSWTQQTKLTPDDGDRNDYFGQSVALPSDGSTALIGAYGDDNPNGEDAGSAYVFGSSSTGVTFDQAVDNKLSTATELDETAVVLSEKADAEQVINQLRTDLDAGEFDSSALPREAVQRLRFGELLATRLIARTSDRTTESIINETQIAVEMTEFAVNLGVSLALSQLSLTEALKGTRFASLTPDSEWAADNFDGATIEIVRMLFPDEMARDALSEITATATDAYQRIIDGQFSDTDQFTDYLSDSLSGTIANLSIQRTIETGSGVNPMGGVSPLVTSIFDANLNVESSLDRLNDVMSSGTLQAEGLDGTRANAREMTNTVRSTIDEVAGVTQTFLTELQNNLEYIGIAENAYQLIDGALNGELELWEAAGIIGELVPKSGLAVATVRSIGVYVGRLMIRLLMTAMAVGTLGIQRGEELNLDSIDEFLPDVETVLSETTAVGNRWGDVA